MQSIEIQLKCDASWSRVVVVLVVYVVVIVLVFGFVVVISVGRRAERLPF